MASAGPGGQWIMVAAVAWSAVSCPAASPTSGRTIEAAVKPGMPFVEHATTTLDELPPLPIDGPLDRFGGLKARRATPSGFFRVERILDRWWLVDPDGAVFISRGMNSIAPVRTDGGREALVRRFGSLTRSFRSFVPSTQRSWPSTVTIRCC